MLVPKSRSNYRKKLTEQTLFLATMIFSVVLVPNLVPAATQSTSRSLVGTWKLDAYEDRFADGRVEYPYGKNPLGLLIYDKFGNMAVQIMTRPRSKVASGDETKITVEEKIALFDSYTAYFGKYSVDWKRLILTHKVFGDLSDVYVGTNQKRPFELRGNRLTFRFTWKTSEGKRVESVRTFERVRSRRN